MSEVKLTHVEGCPDSGESFCNYCCIIVAELKAQLASRDDEVAEYIEDWRLAKTDRDENYAALEAERAKVDTAEAEARRYDEWGTKQHNAWCEEHAALEASQAEVARLKRFYVEVQRQILISKQLAEALEDYHEQSRLRSWFDAESRDTADKALAAAREDAPHTT